MDSRDLLAESLKSFNKEIEDFVKTIPDKVVVFQKKIVLEALRRVVMKTPVATGRARGNWQVSIGSPAGTKLDVTDKAGQATIAAGLAALTGLPPYQVVFIDNNLEYIELLEHGGIRVPEGGITKDGKKSKVTADGHSIQAPAGMLALTIEELRQMFQ